MSKIINKVLTTPNLNFDTFDLEIGYVSRLLGMKFSGEEIKNLLIKMGIESEITNEEKIKVRIPPYRTDILHQMDIVEEIAIAYGYENFVPEKLKSYTVGEISKFEKFCNEISLKMVGLGFSEIMSLNLTNKENLFKKMNVEDEQVVETENALSTEHCIIRNYLLPSLLLFLEKNKTKKYPQKIFEIGKCISYNKNLKNFEELTKIGAIIASPKTNFSEIKSVVGGILKNFNVKESNYKFFIEGRQAEILINDIVVGFFGEISVNTIRNFNLEIPLTGFEINLNKLDKFEIL